jgi:hypothetical protein
MRSVELETVVFHKRIDLS